MKDNQHIVHKRFFDINGYNEPGLRAHPPSPSLTIQQLFENLRNDLPNHDTPQKFLASNKANVVKAMGYIILKHCMNDNDAIENLLAQRALIDKNTYEPLPPPQQTLASRKQLFDDTYIPNSLANLGSGPFWLTDTDMNIYSLIFNIDVWAVLIVGSNSVDRNRINKVPHMVFYGNGVLRDPATVQPQIQRAMVHMINSGNNHYYGVTD